MPKNLLILVPDDAGKEQFACFGAGLAPDQQPSLPTIGRLAQAGVRFQRAYTQPWCSPTRAEMATGAYGFRTGIGSLAEATQQPLLNGEVCLPRALKLATANGYACAEIGKHHLSDFQSVGGEAQQPCLMGYDLFSGSLRNLDSPQTYYSWTETTSKMGTSGGIRVQQRTATEYAPLRQLETALSWIGDQTQPWLLNFTLNLPHAPYQRPPEGMYDAARWVLPDITAPGIDASARPYYKSALEAMDTIISRLLSGIPQATLANTVIVFWSDNGTPGEVLDQAYIDAGLGGHAKRTVYELGCNTPLIVSGAGVSGPGREVTSIVKTVDLLYTLIEAAGGDVGLVPANPAHIRDSVSFWPIVQNLAGTPRTYTWLDLFGPNAPHTACSIQGSRAIVYDRYKLMKLATTGITFPNGVGGATNGTDLFFDLTADPLELSNLIGAGSPFVSGSVITLTDVNALHPGALTAYNAAVSTYASLTASL